jgi:UDP-glucose 4-epimerase
MQPVILDDFSNSHPAVLQRLEQLTGRRVLCEKGNVLDTGFVADVLRRYGCVAAVITLPASKRSVKACSSPSCTTATM